MGYNMGDCVLGIFVVSMAVQTITRTRARARERERERERESLPRLRRAAMPPCQSIKVRLQSRHGMVWLWGASVTVWKRLVRE